MSARVVGGYQLERGIAPPAQPEVGGRRRRYPLADMEVGESVLIKPEQGTAVDIKWACAHVRRTRGFKFIRRINSAGVRVWRIA